MKLRKTLFRCMSMLFLLSFVFGMITCVTPEDAMEKEKMMEKEKEMMEEN